MTAFAVVRYVDENVMKTVKSLRKDISVGEEREID